MSVDDPLEQAVEARPWVIDLMGLFQRGVECARSTLEAPETIHERTARLAFEGSGGGSKTSFLEELAEQRSWVLDESLAPTLLYIRQSALVAAWSSLEAYSEDLWVAALNQAGPNLRKRAFLAAAHADQVGDSIPGLGQRQVELRLLAEYDFDLRSCLGRLLRKKFSFKTVDGILDAYKVTFGDRELFSEPEPLKLLEATRHVIVHRGGFIDQEYIDRVGLADAKPGEPIEVDRSPAMSLITHLERQGRRMFHRVALKLQELDPIEMLEETPESEPA